MSPPSFGQIVQLPDSRPSHAASDRQRIHTRRRNTPHSHSPSHVSSLGTLRSGAAHPELRSIARHQPARQLPRCSAAAELVTALQLAPVRDVAATIVAGTGAIAWVKLFDYLATKEVFDQKLSRKLVHMTAGPLFLVSWPLFSADPAARYYAMLIPALNMLRLTLIGSGVIESPNTVRAVSRTDDRRELLRGPLYYVAVLVGVTLCYWRDSAVGVTAVALMCGGDGLADIVGRRLGAGNPLPHNSAKSWAGSFAMFAGGFAMAMGFIAAFSALGYFDCDLPATASVVATISAAATLVESLPINQRVDDNLSVPGIAAVMGYIMLKSIVII